MSAQPLPQLIAPDWADALAPVADRIAAMGDFLRAELAAGRGYFPAGANVLRAFTRPLGDVRVLVVGQDPYPTPGHAVGLSFSVAPNVRPLPRSLANIYAELNTDLGIAPAVHGDLSAWFSQGVLLLNRVLTVRPGAPGSTPTSSPTRPGSGARAGSRSPSRRSKPWWRGAGRWWRSSGVGTRRICNR